MPSSTANPSIAVRLATTKTVDEPPRVDAPGSICLLTGGLAAGEEQAFREFHERYFDRLYQFLLVVARGCEDEAQEALQQTLLRVLRYARVFDSEEAFWSWLKVLARSAARDAGRKQHRYLELLRNFASHWRAPPPDTEENRMQVVVRECLEEITAVDRQLVQGKYLDGLSVRELAMKTGLSDKAVESRLLRARQQLRTRTLEKLRAP